MVEQPMRQQRGNGASGNTAAGVPSSAWSPFRSTVFTVLWLAAVVSNVGVWMQNAAAGWVMTGLTSDPLLVSLVQVAASVPMFLFALPAGALADIVDRRRLLIAMQVAAGVLVTAFGFLVHAGRDRL
jgi:MFS family permease